MLESRVCVYCLCPETPEAPLTVDHVIARSWYPEDMPNVEKWKVPACVGCNNRFSPLESRALAGLAWGLPPSNPALAPIIESVRRSIDPSLARSPEDRERRAKAFDALQKRIVPVESKKAPGVLPGFSKNFDAGSRTGVKVLQEELDLLIEKWIRGVHFRETGNVIPSDHTIEVQHLHDEDAEDWREVLGLSTRIRKGPGVEVMYLNTPAPGGFVAFYRFDLWEMLRVYGTVQPTALLEAE